MVPLPTKGVPSLLQGSSDAFGTARGGPSGEIGASCGSGPGRLTARQARIFEVSISRTFAHSRMLGDVALCRSSFGRTFRPDMSKLEGNTLALEGVTGPSFLSVIDKGREERAGFQSGEPDIVLYSSKLNEAGVDNSGSNQ